MKNSISSPEISKASNAFSSASPRMLRSESSIKQNPNKAEKPKGFFLPERPGTRNTPGNWAVDEDPWLIEKPHWTDTPSGKAAIEVVSRLTLGGIFYSAMANSDALRSVSDTYVKNNLETQSFSQSTTVLQKIAWLADRVVGAPLHDIFAFIHNENHEQKNAANSRSQDFLTFRRTHTPDGKRGRSLGAEMTMVTLPFAAMSVGSAIARNLLVSTLNPRERKAWLDDGKFSAAHFGKKLIRKTWEIVSYNAGEDFAVALPYVYYMKAQRHALEDLGFKGVREAAYGLDNGNSMLVGRDGRAKGTFFLAGFTDLQLRFTFYNQLTQIYRDIYDNVAANFKSWSKDGMPVAVPEWIKKPETGFSTLGAQAKSTLRYGAISFTRSFAQMTVAVPFFSLLRIPGGRPGALAIHATKGALYKDGGLDKDKNQIFSDPLRASNGYYYKGQSYGANGNVTQPYDGSLVWSNGDKFDGLSPFRNFKDPNSTLSNSANVPANVPFDHFNWHTTADIKYGTKSERGIRPSQLYGNPGVKAVDKIGGWLHRTAEADWWENATQPIFKGLGYKSGTQKDDFMLKRLSKDAMLAGIPYAAYFAAKVYARESYVNLQTNMAVERFVDGILSFNKDEVARGFSEIAGSVLRRPLEDPERQAELIKRHAENRGDKSPRPVDWNADLHKKLLHKIDDGAEYNKHAVVQKLNQERTDYYDRKMQSKLLTTNPEAAISPVNTVKNILSRSPIENWREYKESQEKDAGLAGETSIA